MRTLDRKLLRDLARMWMQVLAIALLIACGVSVAAMAFSTQEALVVAQARYYERTRFADVFATAKRVPLSITADLARIDGVVAVDARPLKSGLMQIPGLVRPAIATLIGLPVEAGSTGSCSRKGAIPIRPAPMKPSRSRPFSTRRACRSGSG
jgi:putative ABC transport system permease protein